jgi:hypothetical protein
VGHRDHFGLPYTEVVATIGHSLASVGFTVAAVTLAEPLRKAFREHLDVHGCGTGDSGDPRYVGGCAHCPEAMRLWDLLPDGDRIGYA